MYHESDPLHGSVVPGSLPNIQNAFKGYKPLSITQRQPQDETMSAVSLGSLLATSSPSSSLSATSAQLTELPSQLATSKLHVFELLNEDVKLPAMETLHWCKVFEFQEFSQKQHLVKVSYFLFKFLTLWTFLLWPMPPPPPTTQTNYWLVPCRGTLIFLSICFFFFFVVLFSVPALQFGWTKFDFISN